MRLMREAGVRTRQGCTGLGKEFRLVFPVPWHITEDFKQGGHHLGQVVISSHRQLDQECPVEGQVGSEGLVKSSLHCLSSLGYSATR